MIGTWSLPVAGAAFAMPAVVIALAGTRLARVVDRLADRTGLGEAVAGAVMLGAATSLAGLMVTVVAAASNEPSVAISNSVGGSPRRRRSWWRSMSPTGGRTSSVPRRRSPTCSARC